MEREVKFRGKPCYMGSKQPAWVYGTFQYLAQRRVHYGATNNGTFEPRHDKGCIVDLYGIKTEVLCDTVGQFSTLHDKNGKEIYEGDIVKWAHDGLCYVVEFKRGMFYASAHELNDGVFGGYSLWVLCDDNDLVEIIGNIHDNQDLIKNS